MNLLHPDYLFDEEFSKQDRVKRWVVSIPHTGTRFLREVLTTNSNHVGGGWQKKDNIFQMCHVFSPMRNPTAVWDSWMKRLGSGGRSLKQFNLCWEDLGRLDRCYPVHFIHLDLPDRDNELGAASELLGESLTANWASMVGHAPTRVWDGPVPVKPDWEMIYRLPMIRGFYQ